MDYIWIGLKKIINLIIDFTLFIKKEHMQFMIKKAWYIII